MKRIGILGGLGPESTAAYYTIITRTYFERRNDYAYPEILIYSVSFQRFIDAGYEIADDVRNAICALHRAGADFVVAACNSIHVVHAELSQALPIPWVSIMDATAEAIAERGLTRIGLLGTIFTMQGDFYQRVLSGHGIDVLTPHHGAQQRINNIIYDELVIGTVTTPARDYVLGAMSELEQRGAQGIVLGCTELPFLIQQAHTDMPVFDTTEIHARKALDLALGDG